MQSPYTRHVPSRARAVLALLGNLLVGWGCFVGAGVDAVAALLMLLVAWVVFAALALVLPRWSPSKDPDDYR